VHCGKETHHSNCIFFSMLNGMMLAHDGSVGDSVDGVGGGDEFSSPSSSCSFHYLFHKGTWWLP
jgi:hypothetical protein